MYQRLVEIDAERLVVDSSERPPAYHSSLGGLSQLPASRISAWQKEHAFQEEPFEVLKIGLLRERAELYDLINRRSEQMLEAGLLDEVRGLISRGYSLDLKPLRSVGYRQMGEVIARCKNRR